MTSLKTLLHEKEHELHMRDHDINELQVKWKNAEALNRELTARNNSLEKDLETSQDSNRNLVRVEKETRAQFNDLKTRLAELTSRYDRLAGYVDRVHEDDGVREDLIPTGDVERAPHLIPKRKVVRPERMPDVQSLSLHNDPLSYSRSRDEHFEPRHWVTY